MIIIDTPFHISLSSYSNEPVEACTGKCKKVFWNTDFENNPTMGLCPMCGDGLTKAVKDVHYKIIDKQDRNLTINDFKKFEQPGLNSGRPKDLEGLLKNGAKFAHSSIVKSKFIERAITQWEGNKPRIDITVFNKK